MMQESLRAFPINLEMKINSLLHHAEPNGHKAFQLYKNCKNDQLWQNSFELFRVHLSDYYSLPQSDRNKTYFDQFLDRPMSRQIYDEFQLNFRTAELDQNMIHDIAEWAHETIDRNCNVEKSIHTTDVMESALRRVTNPLYLEKDSHIEFSDFCKAWQSVLFKLFGKKYEKELEKILIEITNSSNRNQITESNEKRKHTIYLTQTEIDWVDSVSRSVQKNELIEKFPLSRGPGKDRLIQLLKSCMLYNIIKQKSDKTFDHYLKPLANTINQHCEWLKLNARP